MPSATKRGAERTPLDARLRRAHLRRAASPASRSRASLRGSGARVLVVDRYEIGERQTSACAAPTAWLERSASRAPIRQTFGELVIHTPAARRRATACRGRSRRSTTATLCALLREQGDCRVRDREGRGPHAATTVHTDRGDLRAPLVVDALGWRRVPRPRRERSSRPTRCSRAGSRCTRDGLRRRPGDLDRPRVRAGRLRLGFPARDEVRVGVGSFDPRFHVKEPTVRLAERPRAPTRSATRATGSRTSCAPRPRTASSSPATRPATACR